MLSKKQLSRILLGNMLMICYFKDPSIAQMKYCISNIYPTDPSALYGMARKGGADVTSMIPDEN
jgi:hypothetical protein